MDQITFSSNKCINLSASALKKYYFSRLFLFSSLSQSSHTHSHTHIDTLYQLVYWQFNCNSIQGPEKRGKAERTKEKSSRPTFFSLLRLVVKGPCKILSNKIEYVCQLIPFISINQKRERRRQSRRTWTLVNCRRNNTGLTSKLHLRAKTKSRDTSINVYTDPYKRHSRQTPLKQLNNIFLRQFFTSGFLLKRLRPTRYCLFRSISTCCCEIIWWGAKAIGNVWAGYCIPAKSCVEWGQELLHEITRWWLLEEPSQQHPRQDEDDANDELLESEAEMLGLLLEFTWRWWQFLPHAFAIKTGIVGDFVNDVPVTLVHLLELTICDEFLLRCCELTTGGGRVESTTITDAEVSSVKSIVASKLELQFCPELTLEDDEDEDEEEEVDEEVTGDRILWLVNWLLFIPPSTKLSWLQLNSNWEV